MFCVKYWVGNSNYFFFFKQWVLYDLFVLYNYALAFNRNYYFFFFTYFKMNCFCYLLLLIVTLFFFRLLFISLILTQAHNPGFTRSKRHPNQSGLIAVSNYTKHSLKTFEIYVKQKEVLVDYIKIYGLHYWFMY